MLSRVTASVRAPFRRTCVRAFANEALYDVSVGELPPEDRHPVYLDMQATTPLDPRVLDDMVWRASL